MDGPAISARAIIVTIWDKHSLLWAERDDREEDGMGGRRDICHHGIRHRWHPDCGQHPHRLPALLFVLCLLAGTSGCSAPRTPSLPWARTSGPAESATVSAKRAGDTDGSGRSGQQTDPIDSAWTDADNGKAVRPDRCARLAERLVASQTRFDAGLGGKTPASGTTGPSVDDLNRRLLMRGLTTVALSCPSQTPAAVFSLARLGPASLPSAPRLRAVATAMGDSAGSLARALDREHFTRRFLRLSSADAAASRQSGGTDETQEDRVGGLSDVFARPAVRAGKADPRGKIYDTSSMDAGSLARPRTDPASGLDATNAQILAMDEARAAASALPAAMRSEASRDTKKTAVATAVFFARRAYEAGYPLSYPVLLEPGTGSSR